MADLRELPLFIMQELSGPYGPNVTDMVRQIGKWYDAYSGGAEFDLDDEDEEAFEHTRLHSKKIRYLINTQAQFMVGKAPDLKITCPEESNTDQGLSLIHI